MYMYRYSKYLQTGVTLYRMKVLMEMESRKEHDDVYERNCYTYMGF